MYTFNVCVLYVWVCVCARSLNMDWSPIMDISHATIFIRQTFLPSSGNISTKK